MATTRAPVGRKNGLIAPSAERSSEGAGKNPPAFPAYEVIAPLRHDGRRYAPGDLVSLAPEQAARLIGLRVVGLIEPEA
ncbi:MAG: hypothetical protein Q8O33_04510 [Pseudomonadota bacterium]|nr:hypothetical protein [Pseudomonadota bacterium]